MNRNRLLIWIISVLLIANAATIISFLVYSSKMKNVEAGKVEIPVNQSVMFFGEQLGLNTGQRQMVMRFTRTYHMEARSITNKINILRYQMIDEMADEKPDNDKLNKISNDIGDLHSKLKKTTISYYMDLKSICDRDQQKRLHELFRVMADPEGNINSFGRGRGPQGMMRGRRGPGWMNNQQNPNY